MMKKSIDINGYKHILYASEHLTTEDLKKKSQKIHQKATKRRSIRDFSTQDIPIEVIENLIKTANTAPSGANKQPWFFCAVSSSEIKQRIRDAAEAEEKLSYESRMSDEWLKDLKKLATNWEKPFLTDAPWLIIVFKQNYEITPNGDKKQNYYVNESVGLACGILINAIHQLGLATLTHTPSPMHFLSKILNRPKNEKPFLLLPVGYPATSAYVPDIKRKELKDITKFY